MGNDQARNRERKNRLAAPKPNLAVENVDRSLEN